MPNFQLNQEQLKAVQLTNGRILVLAGAGSGKTRVITYRIAHLIQNCSIDPTSILGLTFTNKAAKEMRDRLKTLVPIQAAKKTCLSTFHSFCLMLLRKEIEKLGGYNNHFTIYDEQDTERLIKNILKDSFQISTKELPPLKPIMAILSEAQNKGKSYLEKFKPSEQTFYQGLLDNFNSTLKAYNALDFDSLLTLAYELLEKFPDVLQKYQDKYRYIMIDEYQDTSPIQYKIAQKLAEKYNNLCVVGDDDQSIYAFRGAEISHILKFNADQIIKLEQNYRSAAYILKAANAVIANNRGRHKKKLWSQKTKDLKICLFHAPTDKEEAEAIAKKIVQLKQMENLKFKDIAVLYRSNALSRQLEMALMNVSWQENGFWKRGIPYKVFGGTEFADRNEIKDIVAYLRLIVNPRDREALLRIINVPRRGISNKTLESISQTAKKENCSFYQALQLILKAEKISLQKKTVLGIQQFVQAIEDAKKYFSAKQTPLYKTLKWFLEKINYRQAIKEDIKSEKGEIFKWENVEEAINALAQYEDTQENPSLADFIATTALAKQNLFKPENQTKDKLQLMTFHSSKGLEFRACFLVGLEDHILPHEKNQTDFGIEEERRLFYVAMTRAMEHLSLSMAQNRRRAGGMVATAPSRFLMEIPKELLQISSYR